jgi:hypothetical protein
MAAADSRRGCAAAGGEGGYIAASGGEGGSLNNQMQAASGGEGGSSLSRNPLGGTRSEILRMKAASMRRRQG